MMHIYRVEFTAIGAEKMWDFTTTHDVNVAFHQGRLPQPADPDYRKYFYDIVMSEETATLFVLTAAPLSCKKVR